MRTTLALALLLGVAATAAAQDAPPAAETQPKALTVQADENFGLGNLRVKVGEFSIKLGGYIKVDVIHDFDEIGSEDSFDPRTIPTDDESNPDSKWRVHAKSTRLNLDLRGPTSIGPFRAFVEGDFFSSGNGFRMRHAFGTIGPILGGQTWTTFMDEDAMPETLDFESPIAFPLVRQAMVRYTGQLEDLSKGSYWAVAVEDPDSEVLAPPEAGDSDEVAPDLTGRFRWAQDWGHAQLSLFAGAASFDPDSGSRDTVFLWGTNLAAKVNVFDEDQVFVEATYGPGVGRYRGGNTAAFDDDGDLEAIELVAGMLAYEHHWSEEFRSTVTYSLGTGNLPDGAPPDANETLQYFAANFIWQFCDEAWCGVEYLFGSRETEDDARGEANRLQFAVKFSF